MVSEASASDDTAPPNVDTEEEFIHPIIEAHEQENCISKKRSRDVFEFEDTEDTEVK